MILAILASLAAPFVLLYLLRRRRLSLGLPLAYLALLLLIHVPGAFAHLIAGDFLQDDEATKEGMTYTALGVVCFVAGVWLARAMAKPDDRFVPADRRNFSLFCLFAGLAMVYGLQLLAKIPSIGAAIDKGGAVWILGCLLGLRAAVSARDMTRILGWTVALSIYPALMLLLGGFLSYGTAAVIVIIAVLAISARRYWHAAAGFVVAALFGVTLFVSYFELRDDIRADVWGGASMSQRISTTSGMFTHLHLIDPNDQKDLNALDLRLNQNRFVGLAAERIRNHQVDLLWGQSVLDSVIALIPRAYWPDKPVVGGSGDIVTNMTGLELNRDTSWGVGNVMEFYINFGVPGVVFGFLALGWLLGWLDLQAAAAERTARFGGAIVFFLPAVAMAQPGASMVEIVGGGGAAFLAALAWRWVWNHWAQYRSWSDVLRFFRVSNPHPGVG
jgi:hypothetical protein